MNASTRPLALLITLMLLAPSTALGATYWVEEGGDDLGPGSSDAPWGSVQKAADTIEPGDTAIIRDGTYDERVTISRSGSGDTGHLTFESETLHGARCIGFVITGDHVTVMGFEVEADLDTLTGIFVNGAAGVHVRNCWVHDCPLGGIDVSYGASHVEVTGNLLEHNGQWGVHVVGTHVLVEDNEVTRTV
ncbi:MAG: right-handed parallel beta-helix repeat-containing protein, partial [Deltaproteobacteria bacterium]|nr:right-handed parallel beta-helix repeat-containing protein [Deltaproteobacteria bacterium]